MKTKGSGSRLSPIAVDDSEDEVLQELTGPNLESNHSPYRQSLMDEQDESATVVLDTNPHVVYYEERELFEGKRTKKRKRGPTDFPNGSVGDSSQYNHPLPASLMRPSTLSSKKARKRRRKLERQTIELETYAPYRWLNPSHLLPPAHLAAKARLNRDVEYNVLDSSPTLSASVPFQHELDPLRAAYPYPDQDSIYSSNVKDPTVSTSAWVSSMALAAEDPRPWADPWESHPRHSDWSLAPDVDISSISASQSNIHSSVRNSQSATIPPPAPPSPKLAATTIGMKPDQDPSSKHGLFQLPPAPNGNTEAELYIPNPARTLVMEQLPKTHRTTDFVNSWSKSACGAYPVYLSVDAPAAKALVEFATAELARKAWSSPKLGTSFIGLKTHQLKGKPREDLIKVWWYRVDGVGAGAGVGEIEEGEIEGDAAEKEVEVPVKKETKKERKARLAKERQAKLEKLQNTKTMSVQPPMILPTQASLRNPSTKSTTSLPLPPSPHSIIYPHFKHMEHRAAPLPAPSHQLLYHPPLLPQSGMENHWRKSQGPPKKHGIFGVSKEQERTSSGSFMAQNCVDPNGMVSSSISSSRSPSPSELPPNHKKLTVKPFGKPPTNFFEDMDVEDEMELESPYTGARAHFGVPLRSPTPEQGAPALSLVAPKPIVAQFAPPPARRYAVPPSLDLHAPVIPSGVSTPDSSSFHTTQQPHTASPTPSTTPPLAPSEPRAMKNAPKGPSYTKRTLLARQKELEERIARSKLELGIAANKPTDTASRLNDLTVSENQDGSEHDNQIVEERLRTLVLRSQKNKPKAPAELSITPTSDQLPPAPRVASSTPSSGTATASTDIPLGSASATAESFSLDDLAVSFITETIETYKSTPGTTPILKPPPQTGIKLELAARQQRLEQNIAESKRLMAKLAQAQTKQEKDSILAVMRERSRIMEEENQTPTQIPPTNNTANGTKNANDRTSNEQPSPQPIAQGPIKWPASHHDVGVLIVSDDEEDGGSDDGDMV